MSFTVSELVTGEGIMLRKLEIYPRLGKLD